MSTSSSRSSSFCSTISEPLLLDFYSDSEDDSASTSSASSTPPVTPPPAPPCYQSVLLENHLALSEEHVSLFPPDLLAAIKAFLFSNEDLPSHPYRTYHALNERNFSDGSGSYLGELDHKSRRNGYGHMQYESGDGYHGFWKKGVREGVGAFFWADTGSVYQGEWKAGERNGRGHFVFGPRRGGGAGSEGGLIFSGIWTSGKIRGHGTVAFVNEHKAVEKAKEVFGVGSRDRGSINDGGGSQRHDQRQLFRLIRRLTLS